jgi:hypothetical protein
MCLIHDDINVWVFDILLLINCGLLGIHVWLYKNIVQVENMIVIQPNSGF